MARGDDKILAEAKTRYNRAMAHESEARVRWLDDVKFCNGDDINGWQWPDTVLTERQAPDQQRPCLTVNKVRQHVLQVVNDARQNKAAIKIAPTGGGATYEAAQILAGLCRHIEYRSQAASAYDKATWDATQGGIGYIRAGTRYVDMDSMDQELTILRVPDALAVLLDPDIEQYDGSDGKFAFVWRNVLTDKAEKKHPSIRGGVSKTDLGSDDSWHGLDYTREVEYFRIKDQSDRLHVLPDGSLMRESEAADAGERLAPFTVGLAADDGQPLAGKAALRAVSQRDRPVTDPVVEWFKIVGDTIVDRKDTVFNSIPLARVVGEETLIEGKLDRKGHVRAMRDAQRMFNYWNSAGVEAVALQGKSPYIAPAKAIEGLETFWDQANTANFPYLPYNDMDDQGRPIAEPRRSPPPVMPQAFIQGMTLADQHMMMVSGQYQAELGRPGNETSGVAIQQRQRQGDTATYHYIDHLAQAIRYIGRLIVHAAPKIYDTARVVQIMAQDGTQTDVHVTPDLPDAHQVHDQPGEAPQPTPQGTAPSPQDEAAAKVKTLWNPSIGQYAVEADVGPSFGTMRQEAFNAFTQILSSNKELTSVIGDIMLKNADFPGADEAGERLRRMVPPQATGGASPEVEKLQQQVQAITQHGSAIAGQADKHIAELTARLADMQRALTDKATEQDRQTYEAETRRMAAVGAIDPAAMLPIIRQMVSEVLGTPALPVMQAHAAEDTLHAQALSAGPPGAMGGPMGMPDPVPTQPAPQLQDAPQ